MQTRKETKQTQPLMGAWWLWEGKWKPKATPVEREERRELCVSLLHSLLYPLQARAPQILPQPLPGWLPWRGTHISISYSFYLRFIFILILINFPFTWSDVRSFAFFLGKEGKLLKCMGHTNIDKISQHFLIDIYLGLIQKKFTIK